MSVFGAFGFYFMGIATAVAFNWFAWRRYREGKQEQAYSSLASGRKK